MRWRRRWGRGRRSVVAGGGIVPRDNARRGPDRPGTILELPTPSPNSAPRRCHRRRSAARSVAPHHDAPRGVILDVLPARSLPVADDNVGDENNSNNIARAGQTLGTSLLYLFFATAGAPGWRLKDSIQKSFPSIASFLVVLYGVHGCVLLGARWLVTRSAPADSNDNDDYDDGRRSRLWRKVVAPQRLLVASSAAIGGPATAAALAKSFRWESLLTPSLLVGNVGYAIATFIGLLFYGVYR